MNKQIRTWRCYSNNLKEFLLNRGLRYIDIAVNPNRNKKYWLFIKDENLDEALTIWAETKPSI